MGVPSGTGFPSPSLTLTLKVDVLVLSAGTLAGSAVTVDLPTPSNVTLPEAIMATGRVSESTAAICTVVVAREFASMPVRSAGVQKKLIFAPRVWTRRNLPSILTPELVEEEVVVVVVVVLVQQIFRRSALALRTSRR